MATPKAHRCDHLLRRTDVPAHKLARILGAAASAAGLVAYARYRREIGASRLALECGSTIAETAAGALEYAEAGEGAPMLVIHGAGGGYDQGLLVGSDFGEDY